MLLVSRICRGLMLIVAALACSLLFAAPVFDIPRLDGITIDGKSDDWGNRGFQVNMMQTLEGVVRPVKDFDPTFRLGWDARGLLLLARVSDDTIMENAELTELWDGDTVEVFLAREVGSAERYQIDFGTGADPKYPRVRLQYYDNRKSKETLPKLTAEAAGGKTADGYLIEALIPWENLKLTPKEGLTTAFQVWVYDKDGGEEWYRAVWYPKGLSWQDSNAMHKVRLAGKASPPVQTALSAHYDRYRRVKVTVYGIDNLAGKKLAVRAQGKPLGVGTFTPADNGRPRAMVTLPIPKDMAALEKLDVNVDNQYIGGLPALEDPASYRAKGLMWASLAFYPSVFTGNSFPACDFENPEMMEDIIGPYTIHVTFYDRIYHVVTTADAPGRYGAVIEIRPRKGRTVTRYRTLYRLPDDTELYKAAVMTLPEQLKLDPRVKKEWAGEGNYLLAASMEQSFYRENGFAVYLAGLGEATPGMVRDGDWATPSGRVADERWWTGLKRKLYGMEQAYPAFTCPRPKEGTPAPVVHEGTLAEAGITPEAVEKIDRLLQQWAADSDEGFIACIVRHGVIVLHKAYGTRDDQPMTVEMPSGMASLTKFMSATLMMELVDQGRVRLTDPVDKFLPPFRGIAVKTPLTIRHLYTHTNGGWEHWGDLDPNAECGLADYYPCMEVGVRQLYNGMGYALGGRIIEMTSGESLTDFYLNHLLKPLGCENTIAHTTYSGALSTALDMAKIGQMVLNKGAYGNMRFFSEQTYQQMLPRPLTDLLGPNTDVVWGMGTVYYDTEPLGKGVFGHGAASGATLRIDPADDLVVTMTRNAGGKNFEKYHALFIQAVAEAVGK